MKGKKFEIKIADLLTHLGTDTLPFEQKTTPLLPNLTPKGMKGTLVLYSVDGKSVLVRIEDLKCTLEDECEQCWKKFLRPISIEEYSAKFTFNTKEREESEEEVIFPIDKKSDTIDLEEMLYQAVKLEDPFVIECEECRKNPENPDLDSHSTNST